MHSFIYAVGDGETPLQVDIYFAQILRYKYKEKYVKINARYLCYLLNTFFILGGRMVVCFLTK